MRIKNKYLRNRHFQRKTWKRIRNIRHPYETSVPFFMEGEWRTGYWSYENQIKGNFEWIDKQSRAIDKGSKNGTFMGGAPADFRRCLNRVRRARERKALAQLRQGNYELEFPIFKKDAAWLYW